MDFSLRDAVESDIDQFLALVTDRFMYEAERLPALRSMWSNIIASGSGLVPVISDASDRSRVVHFAMTVFVNDERADCYHRCAQPGIAYGLLKDWSGGEQPFLTRSQVATANAGAGLNLLVIHHGYLEPPDAESLEKLRFASNEHAVRDFRGWNLRSYTNEAFGRDPQRDGKEMGEALGFRVGHYSDSQLQAAGIPSARRPYLWMATRQDVSVGPVGLSLGLLFRSFSPPRFGFAALEQQLLRLAIDGHTDVAIAGLTNTSLTMVKKHFRTIYDKIRTANDSYEEAPFSCQSGQRGVETRRHVLNYLRDHPEELRPYARGLATA